LLFLDPHEEWSDGGPVYDFVADAEDPAIQSHMEAFQSIIRNMAEPFLGTIIRIPLRTKSQASKSEICTRATRAREIHEVLENFAAEFGDRGLLFLRNVGKIDIESTSGLNISIEVNNLGELTKYV
jgi:sacsin